MTTRTMRQTAICFLGLFLASACVAQEIVVTPQNTSGVYTPGQKIQWKVEVKGGNVSEVNYALKKGGLTVMKEGKLALTSGVGTIETSLDEPGSILAEFSIPGADRKAPKTLVGAVVSPEKVQVSAPKPADFDEFWKAKLEQLQAVPANPVVEPADSGKADVEYFKVQLDNINGTHVYGQLAKPKRTGKFPALLLVQYAGVYGLNKGSIVPKAEAGWLVFNIMAHDLPFDKPADFYTKLTNGDLKDYVAIGNDDREKSYFLRMYLGCYRAADYLANRPDWDGKTLVVMGTSQGGLQSIITAAIYPKITAMIANVPAGCDTTAQSVGRAAGWPYWFRNIQGKDEKKVMETSRYYDAVNFASRIKCPALVALGLIDQTCPPTAVYSAINQMQGPKEAVVMINSDHKGTQKNAQALFHSRSGAWLAELVKGNPPPVK